MNQQTTFSEIFNFDEASQLWRANKKKVGQRFVYKCSHLKCNRIAIQFPFTKEFLCKWHSGLFYKSSVQAKYQL